MFSPTPNSTRSTTPFWREKLRNAVDRTVAFATLESYELPGTPVAIDAPEPHPHRQAVRAVRERRPGMPAAREQHCASPLPRRPRRRTPQGTNLR